VLEKRSSCTLIWFVREDLLALYGFETEAEREFFILLLGVNGVGPRLALSVLSTLSLDIIRQAVLSEQADAFSGSRGRQKNRTKILLHLQGRIEGELSIGAPMISDVDGEVINGLISLGYSVVEASQPFSLSLGCTHGGGSRSGWHCSISTGLD